jgi:uncharacterized phiE125 gp8 family phage protein
MTSAPVSEPLTVEEAKAHLRVDGTAEDVLIGSLILTSRLHIESALSLALIDQAWTLQLDRWPRGNDIEIPLSPLKAITGVRVRTASGDWLTVPSTSYLVDLASKPPRLVWNAATRPDPGVPATGIEIGFDAGFGPTGAYVPAPIRHALLLLIAHWYERREAVEIGSDAARVPEAVSDLIAPFRKIRL